MSQARIARVVVDTPLPHLDRLFDYAIPESLAQAAAVGVKVRVRFSGKLTDGWIAQTAQSTEHQGKLAFIEKVVSTTPLLSPQLYSLVRAVADRWCGTVSDVLRAAIPPRQAKVEIEPTVSIPTLESVAPHEQLWQIYGGVPQGRAVITVAPSHDPLELAAHALLASRSAILVVPDARDLKRLKGYLRGHIEDEHLAVLSADAGPAKRYREWLRVRRGLVHHVIGTRSAVFAPVENVETLIIVHDGDDSFVEPHSPYWHAREVLTLRSHSEGARLLILDHSRTAEAQLLVQSGWAMSVEAPRNLVREQAPRTTASADDALLARDAAATTARLPSVAIAAIRDGLARGPVLMWNPRGGYVPRLSCQECRAHIECPACNGPLALRKAQGIPVCIRCGRLCGDARCSRCSATKFRAVAIGAGRTAEEIGKAFPQVNVRVSSREHMIDVVDDRPQIVIATPGSEPWAKKGFAAAVILDAHAALSRAELRTEEEVFRRWLEVASRVHADGQIVVVADPALPPVQALIRWDPVGHAEHVLAQREAMKLTPAAKTIELRGSSQAVAQFVSDLSLPSHAQVLGPVPIDEDHCRVYVSVPRSGAHAVVSSTKVLMAARSAKKEPQVSVRVDPAVIG